MNAEHGVDGSDFRGFPESPDLLEPGGLQSEPSVTFSGGQSVWFYFASGRNPPVEGL